MVTRGQASLGVAPVNNTTVTTNPLKCGAIVNWNGNDQVLPTGSITASASKYTGATTYSYTYNVGNLTGTFTGEQAGQNATVSFNPALSSGTSVTVTYTASWTGSGGTITSSTSTTCTAQ